MLLALKNNWFNIISFAVLFASIAVFCYTGEYYYLGAPIVYLFFVYLAVNWKVSYWFFLFTIPPSVQINFNYDTMSITLPDEPIMWVFFLLFILIWFKNPNVMPKWWWKDKITLIIALQFLWMLVAVIFSKVFFFSFKFLLAKSWLMVCYFIFPIFIFREKKDFVRGFIVMLVPMLITIIVILIHHYILKFRFDKVQLSITGLYYNHVDYSSLISMFLPLILVAYKLCKGKGWLIRSTLIVIILIFIAGIIFSYARAAVIGVIFAIIIGFAVRMKIVNWIMPLFYGLIVVTMVYMVNDNKYLAFRPDYDHTYMHKSFADHLIATFRGKDMSSMERLHRWIGAIRMSNDEPITGYGPHAFYYYYKPYTVSSFRTYVSRNNEHSTTHNYFLYMLTEQGWPAMLLYALLIPAIFAKSQRLYHRFKDKFYRLVTIGLCMTIAVGFINNFFSELIETHKVGALFYIPVALLLVLDNICKKMEREEIVPA